MREFSAFVDTAPVPPQYVVMAELEGSDDLDMHKFDEVSMLHPRLGCAEPRFSRTVLLNWSRLLNAILLTGTQPDLA